MPAVFARLVNALLFCSLIKSSQIRFFREERHFEKEHGDESLLKRAVFRQRVFLFI